jgi:hypothetical protein
VCKSVNPGKTYNRKERYDVAFIHALMADGWINQKLDGDLVRLLDSDRLHNFFINGSSCVYCGLAGTYYVKEQHKRGGHIDSWHLNLYAVKDGAEIQMTKDHIKPKAKGGRNHVTNYQTMCFLCNNLKKDTEE